MIITKMTYRGTTYGYTIIDRQVRVFVLNEEIPLSLDDDPDIINECILDNIDPNSIPWDELFDTIEESTSKET